MEQRAEEHGQAVVRGDMDAVMDDHAICEIRYSNDEKSVTLRTRWEDRDGQPLIVEVRPVD
jgi:hypothetical protein